MSKAYYIFYLCVGICITYKKGSEKHVIIYLCGLKLFNTIFNYQGVDTNSSQVEITR